LNHHSTGEDTVVIREKAAAKHRMATNGEIVVHDRTIDRASLFVVRVWNYARRRCDMMFYRAAFAIASVRRGRLASAVVYPHEVFPRYTIWKTCMLLGLRITPARNTTGDVCMYWEDSTVCAPPAETQGILNARCTDISKDVVERRFAEVFGYPLAIDPVTHTGPYVRKSRLNAAHNGTVRVGSPDVSEVDTVYERLIDNSTDEGWQIVDLRTAIVGKQIPVVFLLYRSITDRFGTDSLSCHLISADEVFSEIEQRHIMELAQAMGLDYGELDILRDSADGRIYVVDVNKTPVGPPGPLQLGERHRAMWLIARAFQAEFLRRT
jgi:hypothetical protein